MNLFSRIESIPAGPAQTATPAIQPLSDGAWESLLYPLGMRELQRLSQFKVFLSARVWLHDQGLPCSKLAAKRLAFAHYLVKSHRLSEASS